MSIFRDVCYSKVEISQFGIFGFDRMVTGADIVALDAFVVIENMRSGNCDALVGIEPFH